MNEQVRQLFESQVYPSFAGKYNLNKKNNGEYASDVLEDHWNTFQEGFELAVKECIDTVLDCTVEYTTRPQVANEIKEHFGLEEK